MRTGVFVEELCWFGLPRRCLAISSGLRPTPQTACKRTNRPVRRPNTTDPSRNIRCCARRRGAPLPWWHCRFCSMQVRQKSCTRRWAVRRFVACHHATDRDCPRDIGYTTMVQDELHVRTFLRHSRAIGSCLARKQRSNVSPLRPRRLMFPQNRLPRKLVVLTWQMRRRPTSLSLWIESRYFSKPSSSGWQLRSPQR